MKSLKVNLVYATESKGHGVATAFEEVTNGLRSRDDVSVSINSWQECDVMHVHSPDPISMLHILHSKSKKVFTAHQVLGSMNGSIKGGKFTERIFFWYVRHAFYNRVDAIVAVSGTSAEILRTQMKVKKPVITIYNTVDMSKLSVNNSDRQKIRKKLGIKKDEFLVVGNGQLQPRKRLDTFIEAARMLPDVKFVWVGGLPFGALGAELGHMNQLIEDAPDNFYNTGMLPLEQARDYVQAADVFFLPSSQENHPMAALEAAGAGVPVVLRDIPEYDDTFRGDALMASSDKEFVEIISKLKNDPEEYKKAVKGSARTAKKFDNKSGASHLMNLYRRLVSVDDIIDS